MRYLTAYDLSYEDKENTLKHLLDKMRDGVVLPNFTEKQLLNALNEPGGEDWNAIVLWLNR